MATTSVCGCVCGCVCVCVSRTCCAYPCAAGVALSGTLLTISTLAGDSSAKRRPLATRVRHTDTPVCVCVYFINKMYIQHTIQATIGSCKVHILEYAHCMLFYVCVCIDGHCSYTINGCDAHNLAWLYITHVLDWRLKCTRFRWYAPCERGYIYIDLWGV
jgi:hypothetical protein